MTINEYYPPGLYRYLLEIAGTNNLAIKEVAITFIRKQAEKMGFTCQHINIGFAKKTGLPFCKDCWVRLEQLTPPVYNQSKLVQQGKFRPLKTFLDK